MIEPKYPENEMDTIEQLNALFSNWTLSAKNKCFIKNYKAEDIIKDGFYPYYQEQKTKVLFVGRESLCIESDDYTSILYNAYKTDNIADRSVNSFRLHRLLFYVTYALNHSAPNWSDLPYLSDIIDTFAKSGGISFAFMNLSKFTNYSNDWQSDWELIDNFTDAFKNEPVNFFNKQIELLAPDLIITMNLEGRLNTLGNVKAKKYDSLVSIYELDVGNASIPLFDTFHFAAPNKSDEVDFYNPIMNAWKELKESHT